MHLPLLKALVAVISASVLAIGAALGTSRRRRPSPPRLRHGQPDDLSKQTVCSSSGS